MNKLPAFDTLRSKPQTSHSDGKEKDYRKHLLKIASLAVAIAICASCIAKLLVLLINFFTNVSFHGTFSAVNASPADNTLGLFVVAIPVLGGIVVGLMAFYGSKAIRGHGIPEAMEQVLTNQSKIHPIVTILKPISSAISIGTGGPFGAEGPIIATGGALGSNIGQLFEITADERKILLAAGLRQVWQLFLEAQSPLFFLLSNSFFLSFHPGRSFLLHWLAS